MSQVWIGTFIYVISGLLSFVYILNIIGIIRLRKTVFSLIPYHNSIILCLVFAFTTPFIASLSVEGNTLCLLYLLGIFGAGSVIGANYLVKCVRILVQCELNEKYSLQFRLTNGGKSNDSSLSRATSSDMLLAEEDDGLIIKLGPILKERNSIITFCVSTLVGLLIPTGIILGNSRYRGSAGAMCNERVIIETILIGTVLFFYVIVFIVTLILVMRRKRGRNMVVVKHLKHTSIGWIISVGIFIVTTVVARFIPGDDIGAVITTSITMLVFLSPFIAEVILPQVMQQVRLKRMKKFEGMKERTKSLEDILSVDFSKEVKVILNPEFDPEGDDVVYSKSRYVKSVYECLRYFILEYQPIQEELEQIYENLIESLRFVQCVHREIKIRGNSVISPGRACILWRQFFAASDLPKFTDLIIKIPDRFRNRKIDKYFEGKDLDREKCVDYFLKHCNKEICTRSTLGRLPDSVIDTLMRMENNILDDDAHIQCSDAFMEIYTENLEILNRIVLEPFKDSEYFHRLVHSL